MKSNLEDDRDPVLDAALCELIGGETPPDLSARILEAWQQRQAVSPLAANPLAAEPSRCQSFNGAVVEAMVDGGTHAESHAPAFQPLVVSAIKTSPSSSRRAMPLWQRVAAIAAMILVGVGLGLVALKFTGNPVAGKNELAAQNQDAQNQTAPPRRPPPNVQRGSPVVPRTEHVSAPQTAIAHDSSAAQEQPIEEVPFGVSRESVEKMPIVSTPPHRELPYPMQHANLVAALDDALTTVWRSRRIEPSPAATDEEWCRRIFVRLLGRIPSVEELNAFVADGSPSKHEALVDRLQTEGEYSGEFATHWATFWANALIGRSILRNADVVSKDVLQGYLRQAILNDQSLQQVAYELLSATGAAQTDAANHNAAVHFLLAYQSADGTQEAAAVSRVFLGQRLQCAQCHDHPTNESWKQEKFWQLTAFFRQIRVERDAQTKVVTLANGDAPDDEVFFDQIDGYRRAAFPVYPDGNPFEINSRLLKDANRREALAQWVTKSEEFPRAVVNRVWGHFFGYGFTTPIDDMGPHNKPIYPELFDQLSDQFAAHGYSLRKLTRWVALSDAFRRSSKVHENNLADAPERGTTPLFSRYYTRPMHPDAVYDSLRVVADARRAGATTDETRQRFLGQFAPIAPPDLLTDANHAGTDPHPNLIVPNGPLMQRAVNSEEGAVLRQVLQSKLALPEKIEHLFLAAVARKPNAGEQELALKMIGENQRPETALEDIWWALLNSSEFVLDH